MSTIKLPPLPAPLRARIFDGMASVYSPDQLRARDIEVAKAVLEAAARVCDETAVDATSEERMKFLTAQGVAIYEGMYGGAIKCAGGIRALEIKHD